MLESCTVPSHLVYPLGQLPQPVSLKLVCFAIPAYTISRDALKDQNPWRFEACDEVVGKWMFPIGSDQICYWKLQKDTPWAWCPWRCLSIQLGDFGSFSFWSIVINIQVVRPCMTMPKPDFFLDLPWSTNLPWPAGAAGVPQSYLKLKCSPSLDQQCGKREPAAPNPKICLIWQWRKQATLLVPWAGRILFPSTYCQSETCKNIPKRPCSLKVKIWDGRCCSCVELHFGDFGHQRPDVAPQGAYATCCETTWRFVSRKPATLWSLEHFISLYWFTKGSLKV